jgi:hypothetical protein
MDFASKGEGAMSRRLAIALSMFLVAAMLAAQTKRKPLLVELEWVPQENTGQVTPMMDPKLASRPFKLLPLVDGRDGDKSLIGENRENEKKPREVRTRSDVASFVDTTLRRSLKEWGLRLEEKADLVLDGELVRLFVMERNTYSAEARIRFRLQDPSGRRLWEGIVSGDATRWGRSLSKDNYNEEVSDSLKKAYAALLSDQGFQAAWEGRVQESGDRPSISASALKRRVLDLMKEGVGTPVIVGYVKTQRLNPGMSPEDIVDWKRSGIDESIVEAALSTNH